MRSPIDGVVTDRPLYAWRTTPAAGAPLITVMDLSRVVVRAHIDQQQAALKFGDAARITAPGIADEVPGKVTLIGPCSRCGEHDGGGLGSGC